MSNANHNPPGWTIVDFLHRGYWWKNRGILHLNMCLALPLLISWTNGLDSSLINGLQILPDFQDFFGHPDGVTLGLLTSAQNLGALVALPFAPYSSDILGRRATLFGGSVGMLGGVVLQILAPSVKVFIAARVIVGFSLNFCVNAAPLLILELSYPTQRGKLTSFFNSSWYIGAIISAWVCFGTYSELDGSIWSWRVPTLLQAVVPLLQVIFVWFIPESPRFLVAKGKESEAAKILSKYHANDEGERHPLVQFEMAQIRHAFRMEETINKKTSYFTLFATPGNRKRMTLVIAIAIFSQWSGNGLVSYYLNLVLDGVGIHNPRTKTAINGGLQIYNLVIAFTAASLVDWCGRRTLFIISNAGMLITFSFWTLTTAFFNTKQDMVAAKATIPLIFLFFAAYDIAYTPLLLTYTLEVLPYRIRAKGFAVMNFTIFLVLAWNQFVNPIALKALSWKYYLFYIAFLALELAFVIWRVVETKGHTLEETAALFDGQDAQDEIMAAGGQHAENQLDTVRSWVSPPRSGEEGDSQTLADSGRHVSSPQEKASRIWEKRCSTPVSEEDTEETHWGHAV